MKTKTTFLKAMGIAFVFMAFAISGFSQANSGATVSTDGAATHALNVPQGGNAASVMSFSAAQIPGFGWHSSESASAFEGRLATNLNVLKGMPGVSQVAYNRETKQIEMNFSQAAPGAEKVVQFASSKITKCAFDLQTK